MSYESAVQTREIPEVVELYKFDNPDGSQYYTSYTEDVLFQSNTYVVAPIKRGKLSKDRELKKVSVKITAEVVTPFSEYVANSPILPTTVEIFRALPGSISDFIQVFSGKISEISLKDGTATATAISANELFNRLLPRYVYTSYCQNRLGDERCKVDTNAVSISATPTFSNNVLTSAAWNTTDPTYFVGGRAIIGNDQRLIVKQAGGALTLQVPFPASLVGSVVKAIPGCDKAPGTCDVKFGNLTNFFGFPYISSKNPVIYGFR